ncbi:MAG: sensor histidine kinase [Fibrobacteres bacterium]|nr:sensor histidine kinase [Fibrobacterota bacterium]
MIWALLLRLVSGAFLSLSDTQSVRLDPAVVRFHSDSTSPGVNAGMDSALRALPEGARLSFGWAAPPTMVRVVLEVPQPGRWWLVNELRTPKRIQVRLGSQEVGEFGDDFRFSSRPIRTTNLSIPLDFTRTRETLHLRVSEPRGPCDLGFHFTPDKRFPQEVANTGFVNAWLLGYMFAILLVAVYVWIAVRERAFGWYVFYFVCAELWLAAKRGVGFERLWPEVPWLNSGISVFLAHVAVGAFILFLRDLLQLQKHLPFQDRILRAGAWIQFLVSPWTLACAFATHPTLRNAYESLQVLLPMGLIAVLVQRSLRGDALARKILVAFSPLGLAMAYGALVEFGISAGGPGAKTAVLTIAALLENTLATLVLLQEVRNREKKRLELERDFHSRVMERSEDFSRKLSHDLHDGMGQQAYALRLKLFASRERMPADVLQSLDERIAELHEELRDASRRLHPPILRERGLADALRELCETALTDSDIQVEFQSQGGELHNEAVATHLYRIAQEALTNALRHARAETIRVRLVHSASKVMLTIEDDGVGMSVEAMHGSKGMGLAGIRSRAQALGGRAEVRYRAGGGTVVEVSAKLG